jgi:hypothetical protein
LGFKSHERMLFANRELCKENCCSSWSRVFK